MSFQKQSKRRVMLAVLLGVLVSLGLGGFAVWRYSFAHIPELFRLNKQCQEEGYYMAEFEFKMLGLAYDLDKGHYLRAIRALHTLHEQLSTRTGLIKVPQFADKSQEMAFYLDLQNPRTGAFMDDAYPLCTYTGPTGNVLNHLADLARETGQPLKLQYPLRYLDAINTPATLTAYLDDVATVGWLATKFPQTSFHFTRDLLSLFHEDSVVTRYGLYDVTPEWDTALLQWFYDRQDSASGLWGPRAKNGQLRKKDSMNTASILKAFIDADGRNLHPAFPLRYQDALAQSMLTETAGPLPPDDALDEWHEWNLNTSKAIKLLLKLWTGLTPATRIQARDLAAQYVQVKFEKFYVGADGAFCYYPGAERATLDGTSGVVGTLDDLGAFSAGKYRRLWGAAEGQELDLGTYAVSAIAAETLKGLLDAPRLNSIRAYARTPEVGNYTAGVLGVFYPQRTAVLDAMELIPKISAWLGSTDQSMGNWTSREELAQSVAALPIAAVPILPDELPLAELNAALRQQRQVVLIGFDILQLPCGKVTLNEE
jgi:hypothetical protein